MRNVNEEAGTIIVDSIIKIIHGVHLPAESQLDGNAISGPQLITLHAIKHHKQISDSRLAEYICLDQLITTNLLETIEAKQWIKRKHDANNAKKFLLEITPHGEDILKKSPAMVQRFLNGYVKLPTLQQTKILEVLQDIILMCRDQDMTAAIQDLLVS